MVAENTSTVALEVMLFLSAAETVTPADAVTVVVPVAVSMYAFALLATLLLARSAPADIPFVPYFAPIAKLFVAFEVAASLTVALMPAALCAATEAAPEAVIVESSTYAVTEAGCSPPKTLASADLQSGHPRCWTAGPAPASQPC